MNPFEKVKSILDSAVGGPASAVGAHGAFWRGASRDAFVAKKVFGVQLINVGSGAESAIVKALRGDFPFGADVGVPDADFNRMPSGFPQVPSEDIEFIRKWIDDGCPDGEANAPAASEAVALKDRSGTPKNPMIPAAPVHRTVEALMAEPAHDLAWLKNALQIAVELELATLPPYLIARWSIKESASDSNLSIKEVRGEEMSHLAYACNMLSAVGGSPWLADPAAVPKYPGPLPGGVRPSLEISLRKLTREQAGVFMQIEYPQGGPIAFAEAMQYDTIGAFYQAIRDAFVSLNPPLSTNRQLEYDGDRIKFFKVDSLDKVLAAIDLIRVQGEGSTTTPEENEGDLSHYYRFAEIYHGKKCVKNPDGKWRFNGKELPLPETWDMVEIPVGGYQKADVPDPAVWGLIAQFDQKFSLLLRQLQDAWTHGDEEIFSNSIGTMISMGKIGAKLIKTPRPDGAGNYGPCFRFVS